MNEAERIDGWLGDLRRTLAAADDLVARGRETFDADPALPLAFEALCNRVGDLAKKLAASGDPRFASSIWRQAARTRDFVVHHYHRLDVDLLWATVATSFAQLTAELPPEAGETP